MNDAEFLDAFESCSLPFEQWTHRAHVRVAYQYATQGDLPSALKRMTRGIKAYNRATDTPETLERGYHETITQAFMRLVFAAEVQSGPHESSDQFCEAHPELLCKDVLLEFYSHDRIKTAEAKAEFVEPDLFPLPIVIGNRITIVNVMDGETSLLIARRLLLEFAESLDFDLSFQGFDAELATLPGCYSLPHGRLMLARMRGQPAGCVALRPLGGGDCEMKRLWVRPEFRGEGIGRYLIEAVINEARRAGYSAMRLDTVPSMVTAIALYRAFGFSEIQPYALNPIAGAMFMELKL